MGQDGFIKNHFLKFCLLFPKPNAKINLRENIIFWELFPKINVFHSSKSILFSSQKYKN